MAKRQEPQQKPWRPRSSFAQDTAVPFCGEQLQHPNSDRSISARVLLLPNGRASDLSEGITDRSRGLAVNQSFFVEVWLGVAGGLFC